jgi:hypothetical protein
MSKTKNNIPYERQMLPILRNYDKLVEENKAMKAVLANISKVCKPENVATELKYMQGRIKMLTNQLDESIDKIKEIDRLVKDKLERECYFIAPRSTTMDRVILLTK